MSEKITITPKASDKIVQAQLDQLVEAAKKATENK